MSAANSEENAWLIKRNCSAGPRDLALVFGSIVAISFAFGVGFAAFGLWMVLPFVGLELIAVGAAFVCYGRHAADCERIAISTRKVSVAQIEGDQTKQWDFDPLVTQVRIESTGRRWGKRVQVFLQTPDLRLELGRHLLDAKRARLGKELAAALARARAAC